MSHKAIIRTADQGEARWFFGGGVHVWKARAAETGGAFLLFEDHMTKGKVTPWHAHPHADESLFVLEGEILVRSEDREQRLGVGGLVVVPRGVPHAFCVISETARLLCLVTPGRAESEQFFFNASIASAEGPVDFARIGEAARATGATEILGPPPFAG
jgi:quercetin dioxygenase-like cupin family protein